MLTDDLLEELEDAPLAEVARFWIVATNRLLEATKPERTAAWKDAANISERNLIAGVARSDQRDAELHDLQERVAEIRKLLKDDEEDL